MNGTPNEGDISISKELIRVHNSKFKNNEPLEQYKYQDYMLKNVELHEIDVTGLFFNDDFTNRTAPLSDDSSLDSSVPNLDNDTCNSSIDLETVQTDSILTGNAPNTHNSPSLWSSDHTQTSILSAPGFDPRQRELLLTSGFACWHRRSFLGFSGEIFFTLLYPLKPRGKPQSSH